MCVEPLSGSRNVFYMAVCPNDPAIIDCTERFLKELSSVYQVRCSYIVLLNSLNFKVTSHFRPASWDFTSRRRWPVRTLINAIALREFSQ